MGRETDKGQTHKCGNTKARARGGVARSSEEASVMEVERRGDLIEGDAVSPPLRREELGASLKAFAIPKRAVCAAWQRVKANRGDPSAGDFDRRRSGGTDRSEDGVGAAPGTAL